MVVSEATEEQAINKISRKNWILTETKTDVEY